MNNKTSKRTIGSVGEIWSKNSFLSTLFALLVMILIFRPQGLLGRPIVAKV